MCIRDRVIIDNEYNDLECAIADLKTMHVTYLNQDIPVLMCLEWSLEDVYKRQDL